MRDLVEAGTPRGHLTLDVVRRSRARLVAGQRVHTEYQSLREAEDVGFTREVTVRAQLVVHGWTVTVQGRVDGLVESAGHWTVEEVKSTALDAGRLMHTVLDTWPEYRAQVEIYLWMLANDRPAHTVSGELIFVSLADGSRHTLEVPLDVEGTEAFVRSRLEEFVAERERRLEWFAERRQLVVHWPFPEKRAGQEAIAETVTEALTNGDPILVEAPTGLGKTASVLTAVVELALATDRQVFWATSRTTQQPVVEGTLARMAAAGTPVRAVTLNARNKVCLNEVDGEKVVSCRPEVCGFADRYFDKVRELSVVANLSRTRAGRAELEAAGREFEVCPYQLARDVSHAVDVVVGDVNYVFDPSSRLREFFEGDPGGWIVVCDEVHQLVDRARSYRSPSLSARAASRAARFLDGLGSAFAPFSFLARQVEDAIVEAQQQVVAPAVRGRAVADLSELVWHDLADRTDEVSLDYALLKASSGETLLEDPWLDLVRGLLRFQSVLSDAGEETVSIVDGRPGHEAVSLLCLDPSPWLGPQIARLGGFVGASATVSPAEFYRDLLGLDEQRLRRLGVASPFPPENRLVCVAPRISTAYKDRIAHAPATAELIGQVVAEVPGNVAVYFPSFAMLEDIMRRTTFDDRDVLVQPRSLSEEERLSWLARLSDAGRPVVLAAVLGGIFAEGVDLPPGGLSAVIVCGPAFPPVGLERQLLHEFYDRQYDAGFLYASRVPGLTRVVQAAGRLIRRPEDRGAVVLVGRRFRWRDVMSLLPDAWDVEVPDDLPSRLRDFFDEERG